MKKPKRNGVLKNWAIFSGISIQMGAIIFLFVKGGKWLDLNYNDSGKGFTVLGTLLGVGISMLLIIRQTKKLNS